jgi:plasmid stabilization system protein ParE
MPLRVKISVRAANQIRRADEWWAANRPSAPGAIGKDFGDSVALLAEQPGIGAEYEGARMLGVRRLYLGRVRYFIYYKATPTELRILAFWHASRGRQPVL